MTASLSVPDLLAAILLIALLAYLPFFIRHRRIPPARPLVINAGAFGLSESNDGDANTEALQYCVDLAARLSDAQVYIGAGNYRTRVRP